MFSNNCNDYELRVELANCCSDIATVYLSRYLPTEEHVAVKKYRLDMASETLHNQIQHEITTMRQLNHPNILRFHTAYVSNMEMHLISPFMCYCSCSDTMKNIFERGEFLCGFLHCWKFSVQCSSFVRKLQAATLFSMLI